MIADDGAVCRCEDTERVLLGYPIINQNKTMGRP